MLAQGINTHASTYMLMCIFIMPKKVTLMILTVAVPTMYTLLYFFDALGTAIYESCEMGC